MAPLYSTHWRKSVSVTPSQSNITYNHLVSSLQGPSVHAARSFRPEHFKNTHVRPTMSLLPSTGLPQVDSFMGKTDAAVDITLNSLTDLPEAALKGGMTGGMGGVTAGAIAWAYTRSRWGGVLFAGITLAGAVLGSFVTTSREMLHKIGQMKNVVMA